MEGGFGPKGVLNDLRVQMSMLIEVESDCGLGGMDDYLFIVILESDMGSLTIDQGCDTGKTLATAQLKNSLANEAVSILHDIMD